MIERLRLLLDRPLDPRAGRAALALASAILLGYAAALVLAASEPGSPASREEGRLPAAVPTVSFAPAAGSVEDESAGQHPPVSRQDPQDEKGSPAARRAARALRSHRALQQVPYRSGRVAIALVGARGSRAVLRVAAPTARRARRGWRRFLRRYRDSGRAYFPVFVVRGGLGG